jgi:hypothetical protein
VKPATPSEMDLSAKLDEGATADVISAMPDLAI